MISSAENSMIEWKTSSSLVPLKSAVNTMEERVLSIFHQKQSQLIWLLEHPHVYSGGTSSNDTHLLETADVSVELTGRGGSYTYHGPGQRVVYVMLDLKKQGKDIRKFVWNLEQWIIESLREFGVIGERRSKRVGVWVIDHNTNHVNISSHCELKIASIGLRLKNWVSYYGISINLHPDLKFFDGIISCGNQGYGVTSLEHQGVKTTLTELDFVLKQKFNEVFDTTNYNEKKW